MQMTDWLNPVTTLAAAFAGAWAAFKLQAGQEKAAQTRANISSANRALMTLMQQVNELKLYQTDQLNPVRDGPGRHLQIQPTLSFDETSLKFDFNSLSFFDTPQEFQVLFELSVEERRYIESVKAINARSLLMLNAVHPALLAAGFSENTMYSNSDYTRALGEPLYNQLKRITDDVYYHVDRTVGSLCEMRDKLRICAKARYPKAKFANFELVSELQGLAPNNSFKPKPLRSSA